MFHSKLIENGMIHIKNDFLLIEMPSSGVAHIHTEQEFKAHIECEIILNWSACTT